MKKTDSETRLREAIEQLEKQQAEEMFLLKEQFHVAAHSLQPLNVLKNTLKAASASHDIKQDIINTSVGIGAGYLSKRFLKDVSKSPSKKLIAAALLLGITAVIAKNPETAKSLGKNILKFILRKSSERMSDAEYE